MAEQPVEQSPEKKAKRKFSLTTFFFISLMAVTIFSFLRYFVFKNYDIKIEVVCDPANEVCFSRSCEDGECPPNELENYKQYIIKAFLFDKCELDTCAHFCSNQKNCEEIMCDSEAEDTCSGPQ